ncbi:MAG: DUF3306 domain-containing protein [Thiolinea sp.]
MSEQDEGFLNRWSRLKRRPQSSSDADTESPESTAPSPPQAETLAEDESGTEAAAEAEAPRVLTDEDMPPLESLDEHSDFSLFMSAGVSEELRRLALRKLFQQPQFNVIDELDDYCQDFTTFAPLGNTMTADLKHRLQREARLQLEALMETEHLDLNALQQARTQALDSLQQQAPAITGSVMYQSQGRVLLIGGREALELAAQLPDSLKPQVLLTTDEQPVPAGFAHIVTPVHGRSCSSAAIWEHLPCSWLRTVLIPTPLCRLT